jgi:hypothetical protein
MAEHLCQEVAHFLAEGDGRADGQPVSGLARARLAVSLAEGLERGDAAPRDRATIADDPGRLAAFLDHGLPSSERTAVVTALAHDAVRRAEASSAVAFLNGIEDACAPMPAGLIARAVETFGNQASAEKGATTAGRGQWSRSRPSWRLLLPSFAALMLVAVLTPVVLSLIWDEHSASVPDDDSPIKRSIAPPPGTAKRMPRDSSTGELAAPSCESAAPGDQPDARKAFPQATGPADGAPRRPREPMVGRSSGAPAGNPCQPKPSAEDGGAPAGLPARN